MKRRRSLCVGSRLKSKSNDFKKKLKGTNLYITAKLRAEHKQQRYDVRTIIIGAPSSGKTTLLKQIDIHINNSNNLQTISTHTNTANTIRQHCYEDILTLLQHIGETHDFHTLKQLSISNPAHLSEISAAIIDALQKHKLKTLYEHRFHSAVPSYILHDNMAHFFDKISEIMDSNYIPSEDDQILIKTCTRAMAIPLISTDFRALFGDKINFTLIDTGSNTSCRILNNHLYMFAGVDWVIFVASLEEYCMFNDEQKKHSKMLDTLQLFDNVINSTYFKDTEIMLMLTKLDIFADCIRRGISLKCCFPEWNGKEYMNGLLLQVAMIVVKQMEEEINDKVPGDVIDVIIEYIDEYETDIAAHGDILLESCKSALDCIRDKFESKAEKERIHTFALNSTDTYLIENMFRCVQKIIGMASYNRFKSIVRPIMRANAEANAI